MRSNPSPLDVPADRASRACAQQTRGTVEKSVREYTVTDESVAPPPPPHRRTAAPRLGRAASGGSSQGSPQGSPASRRAFPAPRAPLSSPLSSPPPPPPQPLSSSSPPPPLATSRRSSPVARPPRARFTHPARASICERPGGSNATQEKRRRAAQSTAHGARARWGGAACAGCALGGGASHL